MIRMMLKSSMIQFPLLFVAFGLMPLAMVLMTSPGKQIHHPTIRVEVIDQDQSELSRALVALFNEEPFEVVDDEVNYRIVIPVGYEEALINQDELVLEIEGLLLLRRSLEELMMVTIDSHHQQIHDFLLINNLDEDLKTELINQLKKINEAESVQREWIAVENELLTRERQMVMVSSIFFIYGVVQIGASKYLLEELGLNSRLHMLPLTKAQNFNYGLLESLISLIFMYSLSIISFAFFSSYVASKFLYFVPVVLLMAIFAAHIGQFISEWVPASFGKPLVTGLILIEIYVSWTGLGHEFPQFFRFWPGAATQGLFEATLTNQWGMFAQYASIMLIVSVLLYFMIRIRLFVKWGGQ